ncbi:MAG: regulatory protein GemA [Magnetococcales bacterium]|nr:regulatory protein GemA [Magnetococcales bacterium]
MTATATDRNRLIRLIHVAKRELGLDDATYREALFNNTGKRSTSEMSVEQMERVIGHFKNRGFTVVGKQPSPPQPADPQTGKIWALWREMHRLGIVHNPDEAALNAFIKRETRVEHIKWLDVSQKSHVIERLKAWKERAKP